MLQSLLTCSSKWSKLAEHGVEVVYLDELRLLATIQTSSHVVKDKLASFQIGSIPITIQKSTLEM